MWTNAKHLHHPEMIKDGVIKSFVTIRAFKVDFIVSKYALISVLMDKSCKLFRI